MNRHEAATFEHIWQLCEDAEATLLAENSATAGAAGVNEYENQPGGEDYAEDDGDGFDAHANTHGPMTCSDHTHGKYGPHDHQDDADHSAAPLAEPSLYDEDAALQESAERLALSEHKKPLDALEHGEQMKLYDRAAKRMRYGSLAPRDRGPAR